MEAQRLRLEVVPPFREGLVVEVVMREKKSREQEEE